MKRYLLIFLFFSTTAFAQTGPEVVFHLNKLSARDTLLSGWKFHTGDNQQWAAPAFDDSKWQEADPAQDVQDFKQLRKSGIGWIRLHIVVDSGIAKQQLTAWVNQFTASEIYLNGKLIKKYGSINRDPSKTVAWSPVEELFALKLQPQKEQVIAVRLAYESRIPYISVNYVSLSAFAMFVNSNKNARTNVEVYQHMLSIFTITIASLCGVFLMISFIYMVYYLFDKDQKVNLYYFIFSTLIFSICISGIPFYNNIPRVSLQMGVALLYAIVFIVDFLFLPLTLYALFQYQGRSIFKLLVLAGAGALAYLLLVDDVWGYYACSNGFVILTSLEGVRVSIWAMRKKRKDAGIIMAGLISCIIFNAWSGFLDQETILAQILGDLSLLGFPLGMAFYLGLQNALTNKNLKTMLIEVQTLSQDKQRILADQNEQLERQVTARTAELNQSLDDLRSTQSQLIQREKMASLGELTAGIAHEIQNPLNFVNNFSDVNTELLAEMRQEIEKSNLEEVKVIAFDLSENEKKINLHGKRADSIVKGMLQHSRASAGTKEPTDLNAIADEYLRLAYHGLRAKDKGFNSEIITDFSPILPKVNVMAQDIGRVLLNLFNNAFYAVHEKAQTAGPDYKPTVEVDTAKINEHIEVSVRDNGNGIPHAIRNKIMQPFFTTKPTGEGTGLGLSISYDIIKAHGGEIQIKSEENSFSEFKIILPIN